MQALRNHCQFQLRLQAKEYNSKRLLGTHYVFFRIKFNPYLHLQSIYGLAICENIHVYKTDIHSL